MIRRSAQMVNKRSITTTLPLPVPTLKETCDTYLQSVRPLTTPAEFTRTEACVKQFLDPLSYHNIGYSFNTYIFILTFKIIDLTLFRISHTLQNRLLEHAAVQNSKGRSWLIDWWNSDAYMTYRDPVTIYVSYFYGMIMK